jgi:5-methylcytosine-specific restriction protein A
VSRASKACSTAGCPHAQPCPVHPKVAWAGSKRRSRLPPDWERRRRSVLARDEICTICRDALATEVDHINPGDDHSLINLQGVCKPCHTDKTQAEALAARTGGNHHG